MNGIFENLANLRYRNKTAKRIKFLIKWVINKAGSVVFFFLRRDFDIPYDEVKSILFISLFFRGDVLFHTPVLRLLKLIFVNSEIDVWVKSRSKDILENNEDIREVLVFDHVKTDDTIRNPEFKFGSKLKFLRGLRSKNYDLVVDFTGLFITSLYAYLIRPRYSIGKFEQGLGFLYNKYIDTDLSKTNGHLISKYMLLLRNALGITNNKWDELRTVVQPRGIIYLNDQHIEGIEKLLLSRNIDTTRPIICIHLTAGWSAKRWDLVNFGSLIKELILNYRYEIVVVGNHYDYTEFKELVSKIRKDIPDKNVLSRFFDLPVILNAALIKRSSVFIGSDSLPLHLAGAVQTPTIGLFGPTNPDFSSPIGLNHHVIYYKLFCSSPENHQYCTRNAGRTCRTIDCMKLITVKEIIAKVNESLRLK